MKHSLPLLALMVLASIPSNAFGSAARNYGVSGWDRIRIDAPYEVHLITGTAPFARAKSARSSALDSVTMRVDGRTLIIGKGSSWGGNDDNDAPVIIELGTHDLTTVWLNGAGTLTVDRVKGQTLDLNVTGAGAADIGTMAVDELKLAITGSGNARLAGKAAKVTTIVRGASSVDAGALTASDAVIGAEGPSLVKLTVTGTAKVDASGLANVALTGAPTCTVRKKGSVSVTGCKPDRR